MNAYELAEIADSLVIEIPIREWVDNEPKNVMTDIATMLRQQQAEIEALKLKYKQEFDYVEKKFSDEWWQGVAEYNKGKAQEK